MKILYCITGLGIGGAERVTVDLANEMAKLGNPVVLMYLAGDNKQLEYIHKDIRVIGMNMSRNFVSFFKAQIKARRLIREFQPDVLHSNMVHANLFCRFLRIYSKISFLISTEHSNNVEGDFRMFMYKVTDFLSDINTNVSNQATRFFIERKAFSQKKSLTVYNGIDLNKFSLNRQTRSIIRERYGIEENHFLFLNVGRLMPAKDHKNLITAFKYLIDISPEVRLIIVGEGDLESELCAYIEELSLVNKVILVGKQLDVVNYYNAADCFVLSSIWEGFGIVLAEAMACELPVITTDAGGCVEVIDNLNYIVKPCDHYALFLKMQQVCEMSFEERKELGRVNRTRAIRFDINTISRQWLNIYRNMN